MLSLQANAVTVKPNGIGAPKMPADGHAWRCRAGTTSHRGRFRRETSLLGLFGDGRQGYSAPKARQLAVYLENVGLELHAGREGQRGVADVDDAMRLHPRQVLVLDAQK